MKLIQLKSETLDQIVEKTIFFLSTQVIETIDDKHIIKNATEKTCDFIRRHVLIELYKSNINLKFAKKHIVEAHIQWHLNILKGLMESV